MVGNPSHSSSFIGRGVSVIALVLVGAAAKANRIPRRPARGVGPLAAATT
jgi:hypothetical protein